MFRLKVISVGRPKEVWIEEGVQEYARRLKPFMQVDFIWAKNDSKLLGLLEKEESILCLDPQGSLFDSEKFAKFFYKKLVQGGSRLTWVIGGAEGLPPSLKNSCSLLSFSPMTFTHQMTRLLLMEQMYRAVEIEKGSQYHK